MGEDWLTAELRRGIKNLRETLKDETDNFWGRYWAGYLKAYESLLERAEQVRSPGSSEGE